MCIRDSVQAVQAARHRGQRLGQQGRFADARVTADQHHRAFDQTAAQHAIELADAGGDARGLVMRDLLQRRDPGRVDLPRPPATPRGRRLGGGHALQHLSLIHI